MIDLSYTCGYHPNIKIPRKFQIGDEITCINSDRTMIEFMIQEGKTYKVSDYSNWHGMDCIYLEGLPKARLLSDRFVHKNEYMEVINYVI